MTDRELLEATAKAAGVDVIFGSLGMAFHASGNRRTRRWDPIGDDGDALRLAVMLKIPLQFPDWQDIAKTWGPEDEEGFVEPAMQHNGDLGAATRRAIVRAAAALATQQQGEGA